MSRRTAPRLRHLWPVVLSVAVGLLAPTSAGAVSSSGCEHRVNDTPEKLIPCVRTADLWAHMRSFQAIANANPGTDGHPSRNSGEPGYKASVDYVAHVMKEAGYSVTIQTYHFDYFSFIGTPQFSEVSPTAHDYALVDEWNPGRSIGSASGDVQPAGGIIIPPAPTSTSTSGCTSADFSGFVSGRIALIQRGGCNFGAEGAERAGGWRLRRDHLQRGQSRTHRRDQRLDHRWAGNRSSRRSRLPSRRLTSAPASTTSTRRPWPAGRRAAQSQHRGVEKPNAEDYNVIADSKHGDPNSVLVVDAHLDAIFGAGMLDNASGSATILDIAQRMRRSTRSTGCGSSGSAVRSWVCSGPPTTSTT